MGFWGQVCDEGGDGGLSGSWNSGKNGISRVGSRFVFCRFGLIMLERKGGSKLVVFCACFLYLVTEI